MERVKLKDQSDACVIGEIPAKVQYTCDDQNVHFGSSCSELDMLSWYASTTQHTLWIPMGRIYVTEIKLVPIKTRSDNTALLVSAYYTGRDRALKTLEALVACKAVKL